MFIPTVVQQTLLTHPWGHKQPQMTWTNPWKWRWHSMIDVCLHSYFKFYDILTCSLHYTILTSIFFKLCVCISVIWLASVFFFVKYLPECNQKWCNVWVCCRILYFCS